MSEPLEGSGLGRFMDRSTAAFDRTSTFGAARSAPIQLGADLVFGGRRRRLRGARESRELRGMITQSDVDKLVTVFGGSGFLGRHVVRALCKRGYRVRVAVRRPDLAGHLQPLGRVGQIHAVAANLRHPGSVEAAARDADIVINLVGILFESGRQRFDSVQAFGAEAVALAAAAFGARLVHISAIGADPDAASRYARSKAMGEQLVLAAMPSAIILRPSILFGPEDDFFNKFAALARIAPALPLIGGGHTRFQPVFAGDVASAILAALDRPRRPSTGR